MPNEPNRWSLPPGNLVVPSPWRMTQESVPFPRAKDMRQAIPIGAEEMMAADRDLLQVVNKLVWGRD
jgi:hypothetical protein